MLVKICGLREERNVQQLVGLNPDFMGFIFYPGSPRYFYDARNKADIFAIPTNIKTVGVFVNPTVNEVLNEVQRHNLKLIQLHGNESVEYCKQLHEKGVQIIKAFGITETFDFAQVNGYAEYVEYFLFDTKGKEFGGNGTSFNWSLLEGKEFAKPFLLSGGIGSRDADVVAAFKHPQLVGIDINSRFEITAGLKDVPLIELFMHKLQHHVAN